MNSKKLLLLTNAFLLFLLIIIFYFSEIKYQGHLRNKFYPFLGCILFITFILNFTFFKAKNVYKYVLIFLYSIFFFILALEIFINYTGSNNFYKILRKSPAPMTSTSSDNRKLIEVISDTRKSDAITYQNYVPNLYTFIQSNDLQFPLSGLSKTLTIDCNESGYWSTFRSDRYGFNNFDKNWDQNEHTALLIGDSFTQGQCVNQHETISSKLNLEYKINSLSLGKAGNGSLINLATLIEYQHIIKPKYIVWNFYEGNDVFDTSNEKVNSILAGYIYDPTPKGNVKNHQELNLLIKKRLDQELVALNYQKETKNSNFNAIDFLAFKETRKLFSFIFSRNSIQNRNYEKDDFLLHLKIISIAREFAEKNGSKFLLVYIPDRNRFNAVKNQSDYRDRAAMIQFLKENQIDFLDIYTLINNSGIDPDSLYPKEGHFNSSGYELLSKIIAGRIN